jgi:uncharacterized protein
MTTPERSVTFSVDGLALHGVLRCPPGTDPHPAVVLTGPFTGVKDQVVGSYAERLTEAGFVTLAFDHQGYGDSAGRRGHEDSQGKLSDLRAAVGFLAERREVQESRIAAVGVCLGGGYAVRAAAADPRIRAVVGIAGAYNSPAWFARQLGIDGYRAALTPLLDRYDELMPVVVDGDGEAAMAGAEPFAYYGTDRARSTTWENRVTRGSLHSLLTFDALGAAPLLAATPLLVVHGTTDAYCSPELASELYASSTGPKEQLWLETTQHIDLYDVEEYVAPAVEATATFLRTRL